MGEEERDGGCLYKGNGGGCGGPHLQCLKVQISIFKKKKSANKQYTKDEWREGK